ncbi:hypothetical protein DL95DRAFT_465474 [Leptodontidium sp. 2 PMI_412]|nr:hypothetical protein DL95DRAFT_465474 [Leptodontidium sp. 2 PMI_412]
MTNKREGVCRLSNGSTTCKSKFPSAFNLTSAIFTDITATNTTIPTSFTSSNTTSLPISKIKHTHVQHLSTATSTLLILSTLLNFLSLPISLFYPTCLSSLPYTLTLLDSLFLIPSIGLTYSIFRNETGLLFPGTKIGVSFEIGFLLLVAAAGTRVLWVIAAPCWRPKKLVPVREEAWVEETMMVRRWVHTGWVRR